MIKKVLLVLAIILTLVGLWLSGDLLRAGVAYLLDHPSVLLLVAIAVIVQLVGHWFRAMRTKLVLDQAAPSSMQFQFGALSIGYLFNVLLPFRLGELIRALLVAKRLRISFLYTFVAIVIERATDVIFLGILIILGMIIIPGARSSEILLVTLIALLLALVIIYVLLFLKGENKYILSFVSRVTGIFNVSISNSFRFKVWSLIFGLQNFFNNPAYVRRYVFYAFISWSCYFISAGIVVAVLLQPAGVLEGIASSVSPYIISFSPVDASSYHQLTVFLPGQFTQEILEVYAKTIWMVLTLPMALIGFIALIMYRTDTEKVAEHTKSDIYVNKLLRHEDISQEFPAFLETYFKGYSLSRILHKIELNGELSLVKFFKGGSDAITVLALKGDKLLVKKIVPAEYTDRLRVQYKWLKKQASKKKIVDVLGEHKTDDYYAIDLSYDPDHISLFEYIHTRSLAQSKKAIDDVWKYVTKNIYSLEKESYHPSERNVYIDERLMKKMKGAVAVNDDLERVINEKQILINGEVYDNFYTIMDKIKGHEKAWRDLATYRKSTVIHGDLTVDNILMDPRTNEPFIIDPSDDNQIRGPIIDFARHSQSLIAGYEFLNSDDEPVGTEQRGRLLEINYHDHRSAKYMQLNEYLQNVLASKYLTEIEQRTVLFHAGLLYGRMLAHRVVINPHNTLKYYAVSVMLLNQFYRQYE